MLTTPLAQTRPQSRPASDGTPSDQLISQLGRICRTRGLADLADRLVDFHGFIAGDLRDFERELETLDRGARAVQRASHHLLDLGGKHLRPMCVMLAAHTGTGFGAAARDLAMAVELVHTATLLHDDVVDAGDRRRGAPSARMIYGNAVSVFAGDWLLIQALQRVARAGVAGTLDRLLAIIDEMILAESLQLEQRGTLSADPADYFSVVEGKTAALFRWAMWAGGRAGDLDDGGCDALETYGRHLGVAFQVVDDYLDLAGDAGVTGKSLFTDLREGKMTYPLLLALDRDRELAPILSEALSAAGDLPDPVVDRVSRSLRDTGALDDSRALAMDHVDRGVAALAPLADGRAKTALVTVAQATAHRDK
jgi:octaprenyl-diphosphate synthase